jgi:23S rRNA (adenine2503-C2)-methyltransferase
MDFIKLQKYLKNKNEPKYRFGQIASEITMGKINKYEDIFTLPYKLRQDLESDISLISVKEEKTLVARGKKSFKALLRLRDGQFIETVLMSPKPNLWSVCVSCQVGCAMGCKFCATGKMGLKRDLNSEEICDQILFWKLYISKNKLKIRIGNIVYMGMGEPFANKKNVFESMQILTDSQLYNFGQRHISVSTCGIVPVISEFAKKFSQINLAISLHAPNDKLRSQLMPINKVHNLKQLFPALAKYAQKTNRQIFFEYILIKNINDSDKHALQLGQLFEDYFEKNRHLIHVNLIVFNETDNEFVGSTKNRLQKFKDILEEMKISTSIRKSLGQEIKGACGQLKS